MNQISDVYMIRKDAEHLQRFPRKFTIFDFINVTVKMPLHLSTLYKMIEIYLYLYQKTLEKFILSRAEIRLKVFSNILHYPPKKTDLFETVTTSFLQLNARIYRSFLIKNHRIFRWEYILNDTQLLSYNDVSVTPIIIKQS